jgi:hypothetical protein
MTGDRPDCTDFARFCSRFGFDSGLLRPFAFANSCRSVLSKDEIPVDFLMSAMAFETGETFRPDIPNRAGSGAVGLIQFMPETARKALGTTTDDLKKMTAEIQLDYVRKFFLPQKSRLHKLADVYMAILWPIAVGQGDDQVLFREGSKEYRQNQGLDADDDKQVTASEAAAAVRRMFAKGVGLYHLN